MKISVLFGDSDVNFAVLFCEFLSRHDYDVVWVQNGEDLWQHYLSRTWDVCILNKDLPLRDGYSLVRGIRAVNSQLPLFMLSESNLQQDILDAYRAGVDEYIVKPCLMEIVQCKIERMMCRLRSMQENRPMQFDLGTLHFDASTQVLKGKKEIRLTGRESELLHLLCLHLDNVVERSTILRTVWQNDDFFAARSLNVYVNHLRKHLSQDSSVKLISVHSKGYKLVVGV